MRIISAVLLMFIFKNNAAAQNKLVKDLDSDGVKDTVFVDSSKSITCKLSSKRFQSISSKPIDGLNHYSSGIKKTKNGFLFYNDYMRAGYQNQFRYNKKTKTIQLIGMSRYEFGNAVQDGSGESSVNLLTGDYIGNWYYFDVTRDTLVKIPTIKTDMEFKTINLTDFSEDTYFGYADRCSELYYKYRDIQVK